MQVAFGMVASSSMILLPVWLAVDRPWGLAMPAPGVVGAMVGLSVLSTALAYILYFRLLANAGCEASAAPSARGAEYYAVRPCARCIEFADRLYDRHLARA